MPATQMDVNVLLSAVVVALLLVVLALLIIALHKLAPTDLAPISSQLEALARRNEQTERAVRDDLARARQETTAGQSQLRGELAQVLGKANDSVLQQMTNIAQLQKNQLDAFATQLQNLTQANEQRMDALRTAVETRLAEVREDNARQLEAMRHTVDQRLQATLEQRLGESFRMVSERLELVHRGLGEMQTLANGVGDLKRVLTNVKTRGTWGEVQLGSLLEQVLSPDQYEANVVTRKGSSERVEFAIKLPGGGDRSDTVWLPIDSKFPSEDYQRLVDAQERADVEGVAEATRKLEQSVRNSARTIRDKYVHPPETIDFGILFLPTEGLYAEVVRRPGLAEALQRDRVMVAGPTVLGALLNSLQMGFQTLAIEKRSTEVWKLLSAVRNQFARFGETLDKVQKKLNEASSAIDATTHRSRQIEKKLRDVQQLPASEAAALLFGDAAAENGDTGDDEPE